MAAPSSGSITAAGWRAPRAARVRGRSSRALVLEAALLAAAAATAWLLLAPPTPDLAAQVYRTLLFRDEGFTVFNAQWYAGHHTPGYSLLFPPLAATFGPRVVGAGAAVASALLFAALAERHFGPRARWGIAWFAAATATDLFIGRLTFALGVTFGLAALLALQRERPRLAAALAVGATAASPVAGLFLALAGLASRRLALAAAAFVPAAALAIAFPEGGTQPWGSMSFLAVLGGTAAVFALLPRAERVLRVGALLYGGAALAAFVVATPMGSNATRLGATFAGPVLVCALAGRRRRTVLLAIAVPLLAWQWFGPVRETAKGSADPSAAAAYHAPLIREIERRGGATARTEIPFTRLHWEAVHVARRLPLARGWETQLDVRYHPLFRPGGQLSGERYQTWLWANGVRFVALPDVPLDPSGRAEAQLIRRGLPYLEPVWHDAHWRLFAVRDPTRLVVDGPATVTALRPTSFTLRADAPATVTVRIRHTPYWRVARGRACVSRAPGGWTRVRALRPGTIRLVARFSAGRVLRHGARCGGG